MLTNIDTYTKQVDAGLDSNANSTTTPLELENAKFAGVFIKGSTGTHATHIATIQIYDGVNWWDTSHTIIGEVQLHDELCIAEQIRVKITTVEGGASTIDVTVIIK